MIRLKNPYADYPGYNCFGCSPDNSIGLKMEFFLDGEQVISRWQPGPDYQGFLDVLHGGIQATLMDEIASWVVFVILETAGVTHRLNVKYRAPVLVSKGEITLKALFLEQRRRIATMKVDLFDGEGKKCSEGIVDYFLLPREQAKQQFHFPGKQAFL
jgi:acyl-coenzyme A thioesterase PaaI-like protein